MKILNYRVILIPEESGGYTAKVPAIKGCITYGETVEEALVMAKDAIEGCLEVLFDEGQPIPVDDTYTLEYNMRLETEMA